MPEQHLVEVQIILPPGGAQRELQLPVWNALYQVRDFSQYMNWIRADSGGKALVLTQLNKSRWKTTGTENGARVQYELFADNPGPYGAQSNSHHAFFNLAEILWYIEGERGSPADVEFRDVPGGWKIATPLPQQGTGFSAINYDQLVDSPIEIGTFDERDFSAACGKYRVIVDADGAEVSAGRVQAGVPEQQLQSLHGVDVSVTFVPQPPLQRRKHENRVRMSQAAKGGTYTGQTACVDEPLRQALRGNRFSPSRDL